jgi:hypothetical protein
VQLTSALSRTRKLGKPIEVSGTLSNPNPFPISHIEVSFLHMCSGEQKGVVLFENKTAPPNKNMKWKATVTFDRGHLPEAFISMVNGWRKAQ